MSDEGPSEPQPAPDPDPGDDPGEPVSPRRRFMKWLPWIVSAITFAGFLPAFYHLAQERAERFNTDREMISDISGESEEIVFHFDQHVYLNIGRMMKRADYTYVVPRHRTPGYPFLLSLLYDKEGDDYPITEGDPRRVSESYFAKGKQFNILLSMVCITAIFLFFTRVVTVWMALLCSWSIGWFVFIFRAPFVQPEVLFGSLSLIAFVLLGQQLIRPTWTRGLVGGILVAITFLVKAAILPVLGLFCACFALKYLWRLFRAFRARDVRWREWFLIVARGVLVPVVFVILLSPYLRKTHQMHGSPLWSIHSQHFMWLEDREDKKEWRHLMDVILETGEVPDDAPSKERFFRDHTWGDFLERSRYGAVKSIERINRDYRDGYRFLTRRVLRTACVALVLAALAAIPAIRRRPFIDDDSPHLFEGLKRYWYLIPYFALFVLGYSILYGAYQTIGAGPRLFLSMYPPVLFCVWLMIDKFPPDLVIPSRGWKISGRAVLQGVVAICFVIALVHNFNHEIFHVTGAG